MDENEIVKWSYRSAGANPRVNPWFRVKFQVGVRAVRPCRLGTGWRPSAMASGRCCLGRWDRSPAAANPQPEVSARNGQLCGGTSRRGCWRSWRRSCPLRPVARCPSAGNVQSTSAVQSDTGYPLSSYQRLLCKSIHLIIHCLIIACR